VPRRASTAGVLQHVAVADMSEMFAENVDVMRDATRDADARAEQPDDERVAVADDFQFAANAEAHGHETLDGGVAAIDLLDDGAGAGGQFVESFRMSWGVHGSLCGGWRTCRQTDSRTSPSPERRRRESMSHRLRPIVSSESDTEVGGFHS
jgi:hypothetical protein